MPIIRASCPTCGDIEVAPGRVKVMLCSSNGEASYTFRCPRCSMIVSKPVERRIVEVLVAAGVRLQFWRLPEELGEHHEGPPLDEHDAEALRAALDTPGWVDFLRKGIAGEREG
jgi:hypothetical protein